MTLAGLQPDRVTFLALLSACCDPSELKRGEELHSRIKSGMIADDFLGAALISMYSRCGDIEEAMRVFESEIKAKVPANSVDSWNAIIAAGARQGENMKALAIYEEMILLGNVSPDLVTFLAVLPACGKVGALTKGKEIHSLILKKGIPITDFLGAALINMYGQTGALDEAVNLFAEMKRSESGGVSVWTAMISAYGEHKCIKEVLDLFDEIASHSDGR